MSAIPNTVVVIGHMGDGKSTLCNTLIGCTDGSAFRESDEKDAETLETVGKIGSFEGVSVCAIDTPGYGESAGKTAAHTLKMAQTITADKNVRAFILVLNYQCPRFDNELQNLFKLLSGMYPGKPFLSHVIIVWTRYYPERTTEAAKLKAMEKPRSEFAKYLPATPAELRSIPQYFLDSIDARNPDKEDHNTVRYILSSAGRMPPIAADLGMMRVKKGEPIKERDQRETAGETREESYKYGSRRYGIAGPRKRHHIRYQKFTRVYLERERQEYTTGPPTYTEWRVVKQEVEERKVAEWG